MMNALKSKRLVFIGKSAYRIQMWHDFSCQKYSSYAPAILGYISENEFCSRIVHIGK